MSDKYVCVDLVATTDGSYICQTWEVLPDQPPLLPDLTMAEANEIAVAIVTLFVICFGWSQLKHIF